MANLPQGTVAKGATMFVAFRIKNYKIKKIIIVRI